MSELSGWMARRRARGVPLRSGATIEVSPATPRRASASSIGPGIEDDRVWSWSVDLLGIFTSSGSSAFAMVGYRPDELLGCSAEMVMEASEIDRATSSMIATGGIGSDWSGMIVEGRHRNGSAVWFDVSGHPIRDCEGDLIGLEGTSRLLLADGRAALAAQRIRLQMHRILTNEQLVTAFQPIVELASGEVVGVEALTRFVTDPPAGPDVWFAHADSVGLGVPLELLAVRIALDAATRLPPHLDISVNASPRTCLEAGFAELIRQSSIANSRITIELTEHSPVPDYESLLEALEPLRAEGVKISVDDAGAGFASFQGILQLRPDLIKLDRDIIAGLNSDTGRRALGAAIVQFAACTGAKVIAEGIETPAELRTATHLGMFAGQGFLLGRPSIMPEQWNRWTPGHAMFPVPKTAAQRLFQTWETGRPLGGESDPAGAAAPPGRRASSTSALRGGRFAAAVLDALPDATAILDLHGWIIAVNREWTLFGQDNGGDPESCGVGVNYLQVCDRAAASGSPDAIEVARGLRAVLAGGIFDSEREYTCDSTEVRRWFVSRITAIQGPNRGAVASHVNITRQKLLTLDPVGPGSPDSLTGLADRSTFLANLGEVLDEPTAGVPGRTTGLLYIALDDFDSVNDSYGHAAGDELLQVAAHRLRDYGTGRAGLGRLGGDEFASYLPDVDREELADRADSVAAVLARPHTIRGHRTRVHASIGQYLVPSGISATVALAHGQQAMRSVKEEYRTHR